MQYHHCLQKKATNLEQPQPLGRALDVTSTAKPTSKVFPYQDLCRARYFRTIKVSTRTAAIAWVLNSTLEIALKEPYASSKEP